MFPAPSLHSNAEREKKKGTKISYLTNKGDGGGKEDAHSLARLADEVAELVHEQHGDMSLTTPGF